MNRRVLVVGAGCDGLSARVAQALMDLSFKVVQVESLAIEARSPEFQDLAACARLAEPSPGHGWYQQFAGKKGRHPRY